MTEEIRGIGTREAHARLLMDSYRRLTGKELIEATEDASPADVMAEAAAIVLSHGTENDPVLNYGNKAAMALWEMDWDAFVRTPSRLTAEPMEREERAGFLARVAKQGFVDDYTGIRVSSTGKRFYILNATVWNLEDENGTIRGQAATFSAYRRIPPTKEG